MGWDEVILLYGDQIQEGEEVEVGLPLLYRPSLRGLEAGFLYKPEKDGDLKVKMIDSTSKNYISMCGGLTQVLGKALIETDLAKHFDIKVEKPATKIVLETDALLIPIRVNVVDGKAGKVVTDMRSYVEECYSMGVRRVEIKGVDAVAVGISPPSMEFLVLNVDRLRKKYRNIDFWKRDQSSLQILEMLAKDFVEKERLKKFFLYSSLYDMNAEAHGNARIMFRFYPPCHLMEDHIEEACGTGTVATGIAMVESGDVETRNGVANVLFEVGSKRVIGEPEISELRMKVAGGKVVDAEFSHSKIEIIATGKVYLLGRKRVLPIS